MQNANTWASVVDGNCQDKETAPPADLPEKISRNHWPKFRLVALDVYWMSNKRYLFLKMSTKCKHTTSIASGFSFCQQIQPSSPDAADGRVGASKTVGAAACDILPTAN